MQKEIISNKKTKRPLGQSMLEFALILPVLLMLVFGILEAGRLLFIYGSTVTASRQAVRYGSATGDNGDGTGTRKYLDCDGIRTSAQQMGFLLPIEDDDVIIRYLDKEDNTNILYNCATHFADPTDPDKLPKASMFENGDRIEVTTTTNYEPMVPMGNFGAFDITTKSTRTIFIGITLEPEEVIAGPQATLVITADPTSYSAADQTITFYFDITNNGPGDITDYSLSADANFTFDSLSCPGTTIDEEDPPVTVRCTGTYTTSQTDDVDPARDLEVTGSVTATDGVNPENTFNGNTATVEYFEQAAIELDKEGILTSSTTAEYTYTITNKSHVDLYTVTVEDYTADGNPVSVDCSSIAFPLGYEKSDYCIATYTLSEDEQGAPSLVNYARAWASDGGTNISETVEDDFEIFLKPLQLSITTDPVEWYNYHPDADPPDENHDEYVYFKYTFYNTGDSDLTGLYLVSSLFDEGNVTYCDGNDLDLTETTLEAGGPPITCVMIYPLSQDDMDTGYIDEDATGHADDVDPSSTEEIRVKAYPAPAISLAVEVSLSPGGDNILDNDPPTIVSAGNTLYYTYTLENIGNVTLSAPYELVSGSTPLLCQESMTFSDVSPFEYPVTCTIEYEVTEEDVLAGSITVENVVAFITYEEISGAIHTVPSKAVTSTVYTYDGERFELEIAVNPERTEYSISTSVDFIYTLKNTGSTELSPVNGITYPLTSTDPLESHDLSWCPNVSETLMPGDSVELCDLSYQITLDDVLIDEINGNTLENTATVTVVTVDSNGNQIQPSVTEDKTLNIAEIYFCQADQWTSTGAYDENSTVFYCDNEVCQEWDSDATDPQGSPGATLSGLPPQWTNNIVCISQKSCTVSIINTTNMDSNTYDHNLTIRNNSEVSIEIDSINLSWKNSNSFLDEITLSGFANPIYSDSSNQNGGFTIDAGGWTIGGLSNPVDTLVSFSFTGQKTQDVVATINFFSDIPADNNRICSGLTLTGE